MHARISDHRHIDNLTTLDAGPGGRLGCNLVKSFDNGLVQLLQPAFAFHGVNGVRLVLIELGWVIGKPIEPIYPYRTSVHEQRPLAIGVMVLAGLLVLAGGLDFFILR